MDNMSTWAGFHSICEINQHFLDSFSLLLVSLVLSEGAHITVASGRHQTLIYVAVLDNIKNGVKEKVMHNTASVRLRLGA